MLALYYSKVCEPVALVASVANVPFISSGCTSSSLSKKQTFSTFSRVVVPWFHVCPLFVLLLKRMKWRRVAIITSNEREYADIGTMLEQTFNDANIITFR